MAKFQKRWRDWREPEHSEGMDFDPEVDRTSRAWKAASQIVRASLGDPEQTGSSRMPDKGWQRQVRRGV